MRIGEMVCKRCAGGTFLRDGITDENIRIDSLRPHFVAAGIPVPEQETNAWIAVLMSRGTSRTS
ncbi:hypothetical protein TPR58_11740 [Sphingomonas sp. HF-S3]|uniref:Uncharacterized protein n=1 Tax=Sphingomonas rustica TaxID=3103142 RepID=A0ABV0BAF4_9SPHN